MYKATILIPEDMLARWRAEWQRTFPQHGMRSFWGWVVLMADWATEQTKETAS